MGCKPFFFFSFFFFESSSENQEPDHFSLYKSISPWLAIQSETRKNSIYNIHIYRYIMYTHSLRHTDTYSQKKKTNKSTVTEVFCILESRWGTVYSTVCLLILRLSCVSHLFLRRHVSTSIFSSYFYQSEGFSLGSLTNTECQVYF